jgi:hypothetical protein
MLEDKLRESVHISDVDAKRDIMSILVRENRAEKEKRSEHYTLTKRAMVDQVVSAPQSFGTYITADCWNYNSSLSLSLDTKQSQLA